MSLQNIVGMRLCSKHPHDTYWLEVQYVKSFPTAEFEKLLPPGWKVPPFWHDVPEGAYDGNIIPAERHYSKDGSDLFHGWTVKEGKANLKEIVLAFKPFGINLKKHKLGFRDLI